ncbi:hypothetical protein ElyMa_003331800 [Elysia marginata]|uniref:Uncharacterized protein n=1 Tax=Elysia marginata TaxID=1093978 RepID=A0AAV4JHF0_9GAST|nr:hypothetical protein ElyMa_003331800 [Elysia marginata]
MHLHISHFSVGNWVSFKLGGNNNDNTDNNNVNADSNNDNTDSNIVDTDSNNDNTGNNNGNTDNNNNNTDNNDNKGNNNVNTDSNNDNTDNKNSNKDYHPIVIMFYIFIHEAKKNTTKPKLIVRVFISTFHLKHKLKYHHSQ